MKAGFELVGRGSDLAITVAGPDAEGCLAAAVRGLAASLVEAPPREGRRRERVELQGNGPAELLLALMDEAIVRLDSDGELSVDAHHLRMIGDRLEATLELVPLADLQVSGIPPKAATWHDLMLQPGDARWQGRVMLDL